MGERTCSCDHLRNPRICASLKSVRALWSVMMTKARMISVLLLALASAACDSHTTSPAASAASSQTITVAAASDLKFAFDDIVAAFGRQHPGTTVKVTYGSSGNFFTQISSGAPFDVFLSADAEYPKKLIAAGL